MAINTTIPPRQRPNPFNFDDVPEELRKLRAWSLWDPFSGSKRPLRPDGSNAKPDDPSTWCSFEEAVVVAIARGWGIGVETLGLREAEIWTGDLDKVFGFHPTEKVLDKDGKEVPRPLRVDEGTLCQAARELLDLAKTRADLSPSRTGLRLFGRGRLDLGGNDSGFVWRKPCAEHGEFAFFTGAKFMTWTGWRLQSTTSLIQESEFARVRAPAKKGREAVDLPGDLPVLDEGEITIVLSELQYWDNDVAAHGGSRSEPQFGVLRRLKNLGWEAARIVAALCDERTGKLHQSLWKGGRNRGRDYAERQVRQLWEKPLPEDPWEDEFLLRVQNAEDPEAVFRDLLRDENATRLKAANSLARERILSAFEAKGVKCRKRVASALKDVRLPSEADGFACNEKGNPVPGDAGNVRLALREMGVRLWYDELAERTMFEENGGEARVLDEKAEARLRIQTQDEFDFLPSKEFFWDVVLTTALLDSRHPIRIYLDRVQPTWDGKKRLETWLTTYLGAPDTPFNRAVGSLWPVAAVRRVRQRGCKFDECLILEGPQGSCKSSALQTLCEEESWFTDSFNPLADDKVIIEQTEGKWIVEWGELGGSRKGDVDRLKNVLSKRHDRARLAYGRRAGDHPRGWVSAGSVNPSSGYLKDPTGNRRFWPVATGKIDLDGIKRDRDQLWAEAATLEATGASIRLDESLWAEAAAIQRSRVNDDSWATLIEDGLEGRAGKIRPRALWAILGPVWRHEDKDTHRLGCVMRSLGWEYGPQRLGPLKIVTKCWFKGEGREILAERTASGFLWVRYEGEDGGSGDLAVTDEPAWGKAPEPGRWELLPEDEVTKPETGYNANSASDAN